MAKLTPAQDKALNMWRVGEFPLGTNKRTIDSLVNNGYVIEDNTFYNLTTKGREYLGVDETTEDIIDLLEPVDSERGKRITAMAVEAEHNLARPFVVRELVGGVWSVIKGKRAITWGTANVWRNLLASQRKTVQVYNVATGQVWA